MGFFNGEGGAFLEIVNDKAGRMAESEIIDSGQTRMRDLPVNRCSHCGTLQRVLSSQYCSGCGAALKPAEADSLVTHQTRSSNNLAHDTNGFPRDVCMICRIHLDTGELLAWCPHCGALSHRIHLFQWVRAKRKCPLCGRSISLTELAQQIQVSHLHPDTTPADIPQP
jgi:predicted RNA-binding Zn-ribbon protein involved in translation (DUF1610 family)